VAFLNTFLMFRKDKNICIIQIFFCRCGLALGAVQCAELLLVLHTNNSFLNTFTILHNFKVSTWNFKKHFSLTEQCLTYVFLSCLKPVTQTGNKDWPFSMVCLIYSVSEYFSDFLVEDLVNRAGIYCTERV